MEPLILYMESRGELPPAEYLAGVAERYPWFSTARMLMRRAERAGRSTEGGAAAAQTPDAGGTRLSDRIIANFLNRDSYKITVREDTPEYIGDAERQRAGYDSEMVTEELAEIYLAQGLRAEALEIYRKLCLVNPEKSVYFAELIERVEKDK